MTRLERRLPLQRRKIVNRLLPVLLIAVAAPVVAQFRETPPAPYSASAARQKVRTLIADTDPANPQPAIKALTGLVVWYRDVIDDELIAAWKGSGRAQVAVLVKPLATARVAKEIVGYSWRDERAATFNPAYAPVLSDLMARYPGSADLFIADLTAPVDSTGQLWNLPEPQAEAVCLILMAMPDTGNWRGVALQVLPHYRTAAMNLLLRDLRGNDRDRANQARVWMASLHWNNPDSGKDAGNDAGKDTRNERSLRARVAAPSYPAPPNYSADGRPHIVGDAASPSIPAPGSGNSAAAPVSNERSAPNPAFTAPFEMPYNGPRSGTVKCGQPVPPNGDYFFPGMPPGNLQLEMDAKIWDARLTPGEGRTQVMIIHNKSASVQKRCTARWTLMP